MFSVYPGVAPLLIIRGGFYPWSLSANLPLIFAVAAVALIAGAILLRRILAARFSTSTESNLVPALLIVGARPDAVNPTTGPNAWAAIPPRERARIGIGPVPGVSLRRR